MNSAKSVLSVVVMVGAAMAVAGEPAAVAVTSSSVYNASVGQFVSGPSTTRQERTFWPAPDWLGITGRVEVATGWLDRIRRQWRRLGWEMDLVVDQVVPRDRATVKTHNLQGDGIGWGPSSLGPDYVYIHALKWFSLDLRVPTDGPADLVVAYWGGALSPRNFDIFVAGRKIANQSLYVNRPGEFYEQRYVIPRDLILELARPGQKYIVVPVKFAVNLSSPAGGVFGIRVERARPPPIYRQPWFWLLAGLLLASLLWGLWRYMAWQRAQLALARLEREAAQQQERARIAQYLHDEIGETISQLGLQSELPRQTDAPGSGSEARFQDIFHTARLLARQLNEAVWFIDPANDQLEQFAQYLGNYAQDFLGEAGVRGRLDMPLEFPRLTLSTALRHALLGVAKAALDLVLSRAGTTQVTVRLWLEGGATLLLEIGDDSQAGGVVEVSGLQARVAELGGRCEWSAGTERGGVIRCVMPLAKGGTP